MAPAVPAVDVARSRSPVYTRDTRLFAEHSSARQPYVVAMMHGSGHHTTAGIQKYVP
jgi:hypothetical protein